MPNKKIAATLLMGGLGLAAWQQRRQILAKVLKLPPPRYTVGVEEGVTMSTPDGVTLVADHYYPKGWGQFPTVMRRTPYGRNGKLSAIGLFAAFCAQRLAEQGYHVIMQDVRGRGDSGGEFLPFENEAADGKATLHWISQQPWFNGVVGLWGESYNGYTQWAVTGDAPDYVKALVPAITSAHGYGYAYSEGEAFYLQGLLSWTALIEGTRQMGGWWKKSPAKAANPYPDAAQMQAAYNQLPVSEADVAATGHLVPYFRNWVRQPNATYPYWQNMDYRARLSELNAPVHLVGGWYDIFAEDIFRDYAALRAGGHQPFLTVGPWVHGLYPTWRGVREAIPWFETHLKGEAGQLPRKPICYYVMGADEWREAESWPPPAREVSYFLHEYRRLNPDTPIGEQSPDVYHYDPADPTPNLGGNLLNPPNGAVDNRSLEVRPDVLTYTSDALTADTEVIGPLRMVLYVRSSLEHADFFVRLCDVYPDGRSLNITDGIIRVKPGVGEVQPDGSLCLEISLAPTAMRFAKGHCLRLIVASGAHPRVNRNTGTDEPVATASRLLAATQRIYHDAAHPSALILPIALG